MFKEASDSLKAKLYDFTYTPFLSSFFSSWVILNHKYLLVYFSNIENIEKKLKLLNQYGNNTISDNVINDPILPVFQILEVGSHFFWYPFGFALFYVYVYPYISNLFYMQTRRMSNKKKEIKLKEDGKTPIDEDEQRAIQLENYKLNQQIKKLEVELSQQEKIYKKECDDRIEAERSINKETNEKLRLDSKYLIEEREKYKQLLSTNEKLGVDIRALEAKLNTNKEDSVESIDPIKNNIIERFELDNDELNILKTIYSNNIGTSTYAGFISSIINNTNTKKIKAENTLNSLIKKKIIIEINRNYFDIEPEFKNNMVLLFDE